MDMVCASLAFIDGLGAPEMILVFIIVLVLFGGNKLPEFARGLGKTLREFKKAAAGVEEEFKRALEEDERKQNQLKLAETATANPADSTLALNEPAGPDTTHDHYDHDYHAHETTPETTSPVIDITSTPVAPASDTAIVPEAGPMAPAANVENTILPPAAPATNVENTILPPASPAVPTPPPTPTPAVVPVPNPPPAGDRNSHP